MERYKEYLLSKKDIIHETLNNMSHIKRREITYEVGNIVSRFTDVLTLYIDPNVDHRREQLVDLGLGYDEIERIDINGPQMGCAVNVSHWLVQASSDQKRQDFASRLQQKLDEIME